MTSFVLGIDVGTSYTAAAIGRRRADGSVEVEPLELGSRKTAVPSVVYLGDDGHVIVGEAAERRSIEAPERVIREFKRRIGDETPIIVGDLSVAAEDIYAVLAQWVVERAEQHEGAAPAFIALSHPATWGEHRLGLVRTALAGVGLGDVELVSEPEAAGLHYLDREKVDTGSAIAVYDLGGGTFDVALLRKQEDDIFSLIGAPSGIEHLGGADFDQRIFEHVKTLASDAFAELDEGRPDEALALARIRRDCTEAKEALSFDAETVVPVLLPGAQARVRLVRSEFEQMIDSHLRRTVETLRRAVDSAGLELEDLSTVLLIGGSSRIPAVAQLLSMELELPVAVDADPKASISLGAAKSASRRLEAGSVPDPDPDDRAAGTTPPAVSVAPVGATAESEARGMSIGLRATVLAGVVAAILAILIPITPLAMGTQENAGEEPRETNEPDGPSAGRYVSGAAPPAAPIDPVFQKDDAVAPNDTEPPANSYRPLSPANSASGSTSSAPSSASSAPGDAATDPSPADSAPDPTTDPAPEPDPAPDPTPDPVPDPTPDPAPDPTPDPAPDPTTDPSPDPTTDPAPDPTTDPAPEPEPTPAEPTEPTPAP